ncbi:dITP/XTP pyrophosphatase [Frankliniella fusca]|uniref:DITP/XTP pyrophosphatase n=1 Tax=Frankliniella fusca TaxID=407009 RepID=A0AAE1HG63_9NEOP|nr:dITP/XTP pyrophosphatase [Frankliniella fusca]
MAEAGGACGAGGAPRPLRQPRDRGLLNQARARAAGLLRLAEQREEARNLFMWSGYSSDEVNNEGNGDDNGEAGDMDSDRELDRDSHSHGANSEDINSERSDSEGSIMNANVAMLESLRAWARRGVSKSKVDSLLSILRLYHPFLPKTCRGLLKTPSQLPIKDVGGGLYFYKGILKNIHSRIGENYLTNVNEIVMDVNMDGMPPFRNSPANFFPILGCFVGQEEPFIIAAWFGHSKEPEDLDEFLEDFVAEAEMLMNEGVHLWNDLYPFRIRNYIMDAVARSYVKCCVGHSATFACEKCVVQGARFRNRVVFVGLDCQERTDESFRNSQQPLHHKPGLISPLEVLGSGMVIQFRLDPLHLVYLGVFKRWLHFLFTERNKFQLNNDEFDGVCAAELELKEYCPCEFNRKPRQWKRAGNHFKGTELRRLLLYDGLKVFAGLDENLFKNYLLLQASVYILTSPYLRDILDVANECVREFITHCRQIFTRVFLVYNVHSFSHIVREAEQHSTLEEFSAFKFETYLGVIKRVIRSGYLPLHHLYNRDAETDGRLTNHNAALDPEAYILSREHIRPRGEMVDGTQFQMLKFGKITLSLTRPDCCFMTTDLDYSVVKFLATTDVDNGSPPNEYVDVVSSKWLHKDRKYCYWPPKNLESKATMLAIDHTQPDSSVWQSCPIDFLHDYDSYYKARMASKKAEDTDELSTVSSLIKGRKKRRIVAVFLKLCEICQNIILLTETTPTPIPADSVVNQVQKILVNQRQVYKSPVQSSELSDERNVLPVKDQVPMKTNSSEKNQFIQTRVVLHTSPANSGWYFYLVLV